jgi:hypothetical protein
MTALSADQVRVAQAITGIAMAVWMGVGFVPPLQRYAYPIRGAILALYLLSCVIFIAAALL